MSRISLKILLVACFAIASTCVGCNTTGLSGPLQDTGVDVDDTTDSPQDAEPNDDTSSFMLPNYPNRTALPTGWSTTPASGRSLSEVCQPWSEAQEIATLVHLPASGCSAGELTDDARRDVMTRINFYRWLVGSPFAEEATLELNALSRCAFYHATNGFELSHDPPTDGKCYGADVTDVASRSNLVEGAPTPTIAMDSLLKETNHAMLILAPHLAATAVGFSEGYACQLVFGENWNWNPSSHRTIVFPAPGPNPQPPGRVMSVLPATGRSFTDSTRALVSVGGVVANVETTLVDTGFGDVALRIELPEAPPIDAQVDVTLTGIETSDGTTDDSWRYWHVACGV